MLNILSHLVGVLSPHPLVAPWVAIVAAMGFCGFAILLVEIKKG
jgi:hypothetical protein